MPPPPGFKKLSTPLITYAANAPEVSTKMITTEVNLFYFYFSSLVLDTRLPKILQKKSVYPSRLEETQM